MARYKSFVNGGSLLASDLNAIEDDYECAFDTYKTVVYFGDVSFSGGTGIGTYYAGPGPGVGSAGNSGALYLDPTRFWSVASTSSVNPRSVYYNLNVWGATNQVAAVGTSFTLGLIPVSSITSGGSLNLGSATFVTGSTVTFTTPAAGVLFQAYSGDFAAPTTGLNGLYVIAAKNVAATASSSFIIFQTQLLMRQK